MRSVSLIAWLSLLYIKCFGLDVNATLKFPRPEQCFEDNTTWVASGENHKRWLRDMRYEEHDPVNVEEHEIEIHDVAGDESVVLFENGFELVQLAPNILPLLRKIDEKGGIDPLRVGPTTEELETEEKEGSPVEEKLARSMQGIDALRLRNKASYNFRCAGFVVRKGGPLGVTIEKEIGKSEGYGMVAQRVHIDQDLDGEPLQRMGIKWIFRYIPFIYLVNVWIPLSEPRIRPIGFLNLQSLDRSDLLRYRANTTKNAGGKFGSFASDRKMVLFNKSQEWSWISDMSFGEALVFLTGDTAHGSFSLNDEKWILPLFEDLQAFRKILHENRENPERELEVRCSKNHDNHGVNSPDYLIELFKSAQHLRNKFCNSSISAKYDLLQAIDLQLHEMVRTSIEMRCVCFIMNRVSFEVSGTLLGIFICTSIAKIISFFMKHFGIRKAKEE